MTKTPKEQLSFDTQLLDVYLTGLQSEIEAKLRRVARFREQMQKVDAAGRQPNRSERERAAKMLIGQIEEMQQTNVDVREMLLELHGLASSLLRDVQELDE